MDPSKRTTLTTLTGTDQRKRRQTTLTTRKPVTPDHKGLRRHARQSGKAHDQDDSRQRASQGVLSGDQEGSKQKGSEWGVATFDDVPLPSSRRQFSTLWSKHRQLFEKVQRLCISGPPVYEAPDAQTGLLEQLEESCSLDDPDDVIYEVLRGIAVRAKDYPSSQCSEPASCLAGGTTKSELEGKPMSAPDPSGSVTFNSAFDTQSLNRRAEKRARSIIRLLPHGADGIDSLLDVGCSEGSITAALAEALKLPEDRVFGADITLPTDKTTQKLNFQLLEANKPLPFEEASFSLITCLMCLHHVEDQELMMREFFRVLRPGGYLVIREHDLTEPGMRIVIDIMHGLYSLVWTDPPEDPAFINNYRALYRSKASWRSLAQKAHLCVYTAGEQRHRGGRYCKNANGSHQQRDQQAACHFKGNSFHHPKSKVRREGSRPESSEAGTDFYGASTSAAACNAYFDIFVKPVDGAPADAFSVQ